MTGPVPPDEENRPRISSLERCAGLMFGFLFHAGRAIPVSDETLADHAKDRHDWVWLHLALADHRARRFLEHFPEMTPEAVELMLSLEDRIQVHLTPHGAFGLLPDIERDFADHSLGAGRLSFWFDTKHLVTARHHPVRAVEQLRDDILAGEELRSPAETLVRLQEGFALMVEHRLGVLSSELGKIEDEVLADRDNISREALGPLRRELSRYSREFSALRGTIYRATAVRAAALSSPMAERLPALQQRAEDVERDAATLQDRARLLYEEIGSRVADRSNRSLSALTVISTLLLPPTFVAGAFGMNVGGIPWAQNPQGFWAAMGLCAVLVLVGYVVLRRFRILP